MTEVLDDADVVLAPPQTFTYDERVLVTKPFECWAQISDEEAQKMTVPAGNEGRFWATDPTLGPLVNFTDHGVLRVPPEAIMSLQGGKTTPLFKEVKPIQTGETIKATEGLASLPPPTIITT